METHTFIVGKDGILLTQSNLTAKPIMHQTPAKSLNKKFMTLDIETIPDSDGNQTPYLITAYDGTNILTEYKINNSNPVRDMLLRLIDLKYNGIIIYAHNLGTFDGIFLLKELFLLPGTTTKSVEPLIHNGKILSITYSTLLQSLTKDEKIKFSITFKDSMQMLPSGLRKLSKSFGVSIPKSYFPFGLTDINYIGDFPEHLLFNGTSTLTEAEYNAAVQS
jgi:hypothetical protein